MQIRLGEIKYLAQDHVAIMWRSQTANPDLPDSIGLTVSIQPFLRGEKKKNLYFHNKELYAYIHSQF